MCALGRQLPRRALVAGVAAHVTPLDAALVERLLAHPREVSPAAGTSADVLRARRHVPPESRQLFLPAPPVVLLHGQLVSRQHGFRELFFACDRELELVIVVRGRVHRVGRAGRGCSPRRCLVVVADEPMAFSFEHGASGALSVRVSSLEEGLRFTRNADLVNDRTK